MDFEFENKEDLTEDIESTSAGEDFFDFTNSDLFEEEEEVVDIVSNSSKKNKKKKRNIPRIIINSVISVVLVLSILVTTAMGWYIGNADADLQKIPLFQKLFGIKDGPAYDEQGKEEVGNFEDFKTSISADASYFLVVGCDWTDTKQTDVIVVVCMDHKNKKVSMLQIPRDTYVDGYSYDHKINSVYPNARQGELKINALRRCLSNQLGIPIDHYVLFSIKGAVNVVDAVGGVTMNFPNKVRIENPLKFGKYYTIGPGKVRLSGKDAIGFMRKRHGNQSEDANYDGSDIGRVKQQRKFYAALFKELMGMSTTEIWKVANSCFNQVQTDLSLNEAIAYALEVKKLDIKNISIFGLPGQACTYNGISYYSIHKDDYVAMFNKSFNPYGEPISEAGINIPEIYSLAGQPKNDYWLPNDKTGLDNYDK